MSHPSEGVPEDASNPRRDLSPDEGDTVVHQPRLFSSAPLDAHFAHTTRRPLPAAPHPLCRDRSPGLLSTELSSSSAGSAGDGPAAAETSITGESVTESGSFTGGANGTCDASVTEVEQKEMEEGLRRPSQDGISDSGNDLTESSTAWHIGGEDGDGDGHGNGEGRRKESVLRRVGRKACAAGDRMGLRVTERIDRVKQSEQWVKTSEKFKQASDSFRSRLPPRHKVTLWFSRMVVFAYLVIPWTDMIKDFVVVGHFASLGHSGWASLMVVCILVPALYYGLRVGLYTRSLSQGLQAVFQVEFLFRFKAYWFNPKGMNEDARLFQIRREALLLENIPQLLLQAYVFAREAATYLSSSELILLIEENDHEKLVDHCARQGWNHRHSECDAMMFDNLCTSNQLAVPRRTVQSITSLECREVSLAAADYIQLPRVKCRSIYGQPDQPPKVDDGPMCCYFTDLMKASQAADAAQAGGDWPAPFGISSIGYAACEADWLLPVSILLSVLSLVMVFTWNRQSPKTGEAALQRRPVLAFVCSALDFVPRLVWIWLTFCGLLVLSTHVVRDFWNPLLPGKAVTWSALALPLISLLTFFIYALALRLLALRSVRVFRQADVHASNDLPPCWCLTSLLRACFGGGDDEDEEGNTNGRIEGQKKRGRRWHWPQFSILLTKASLICMFAYIVGVRQLLAEDFCLSSINILEPVLPEGTNLTNAFVNTTQVNSTETGVSANSANETAAAANKPSDGGATSSNGTSLRLLQEGEEGWWDDKQGKPHISLEVGLWTIIPPALFLLQLLFCITYLCYEGCCCGGGLRNRQWEGPTWRTFRRCHRLWGLCAVNTVALYTGISCEPEDNKKAKQSTAGGSKHQQQQHTPQQQHPPQQQLSSGSQETEQTESDRREVKKDSHHDDDNAIVPAAAAAAAAAAGRQSPSTPPQMPRILESSDRSRSNLSAAPSNAASNVSAPAGQQATSQEQEQDASAAEFTRSSSADREMSARSSRPSRHPSGRSSPSHWMSGRLTSIAIGSWNPLRRAHTGSSDRRSQYAESSRGQHSGVRLPVTASEWAVEQTAMYRKGVYRLVASMMVDTQVPLAMFLMLMCFTQGLGVPSIKGIWWPQPLFFQTGLCIVFPLLAAACWGIALDSFHFSASVAPTKRQQHQHQHHHHHHDTDGSSTITSTDQQHTSNTNESSFQANSLTQLIRTDTCQSNDEAGRAALERSVSLKVGDPALLDLIAEDDGGAADTGKGKDVGEADPDELPEDSWCDRTARQCFVGCGKRSNWLVFLACIACVVWGSMYILSSAQKSVLTFKLDLLNEIDRLADMQPPTPKDVKDTGQEKPQNKEEEKPSEKPSEKPTEKPTEKLTEKPTEKPTTTTPKPSPQPQEAPKQQQQQQQTNTTAAPSPSPSPRPQTGRTRQPRESGGQSGGGLQWGEWSDWEGGGWSEWQSTGGWSSSGVLGQGGQSSSSQGGGGQSGAAPSQQQAEWSEWSSPGGGGGGGGASPGRGGSIIDGIVNNVRDRASTEGVIPSSWGSSGGSNSYYDYESHESFSVGSDGVVDSDGEQVDSDEALLQLIDALKTDRTPAASRTTTVSNRQQLEDGPRRPNITAVESSWSSETVDHLPWDTPALYLPLGTSIIFAFLAHTAIKVSFRVLKKGPPGARVVSMLVILCAFSAASGFLLLSWYRGDPPLPKLGTGLPGPSSSGDRRRLQFGFLSGLTGGQTAQPQQQQPQQQQPQAGNPVSSAVSGVAGDVAGGVAGQVAQDITGSEQVSEVASQVASDVAGDVASDVVEQATPEATAEQERQRQQQEEQAQQEREAEAARRKKEEEEAARKKKEEEEQEAAEKRRKEAEERRKEEEAERKRKEREARRRKKAKEARMGGVIDRARVKEMSEVIMLGFLGLVSLASIVITGWR